MIAADDPVAVAATRAVQQGDHTTLRHLLATQPHLASARIGDERMSRTLLHAATDWPGHYPGNAATVQLLLAGGADVNARFAGPHTETPLHWAASSDDVEVLDLLLDHGADIDADGGVVDDGTPLADAVAFGQWRAAQRLLQRGARPNLWQAAALGLLEEVDRHLKADAAPPPDDVTVAFWCACHGGQRRTAQYLLARGAEPNWVGFDELTPLDAAERSHAHDLVAWLRDRGGQPASELTDRG